MQVRSISIVRLTNSPKNLTKWTITCPIKNRKRRELLVKKVKRFIHLWTSTSLIVFIQAVKALSRLKILGIILRLGHRPKDPASREAQSTSTRKVMSQRLEFRSALIHIKVCILAAVSETLRRTPNFKQMPLILNLTPWEIS